MTLMNYFFMMKKKVKLGEAIDKLMILGQFYITVNFVIWDVIMKNLHGLTIEGIVLLPMRDW